MQHSGSTWPSTPLVAVEVTLLLVGAATARCRRGRGRAGAALRTGGWLTVANDVARADTRGVGIVAGAGTAREQEQGDEGGGVGDVALPVEVRARWGGAVALPRGAVRGPRRLRPTPLGRYSHIKPAVASHLQDGKLPARGRAA